MTVRDGTSGGRLLVFGLLACAFVLALKQIFDVDTMLHLSMGKLFWLEKAYPVTEPFCYPAAETPFLYTSWLFAVTGYLLWQVAGAVGLSLAVAAACTALAWLLYVDARQPESGGATVVTVLVLFVGLMLAEDRFIFRPELVSYLAFAAMVLLLGRGVFGGDRRCLWLLPPLALLWSNCHSSIILMFLPVGAFVAYLGIELLLTGNSPDARAAQRRLLGQLLLVGGLSGVVALVNPNGLVQFQYGQMVMGTEWYRQGIIELLPPGRRELLVIWPLFGVAVLTSMLALRRRAIPYLLISVGLLYVSLQAVRFYEFYCLMQAPIIARALVILGGARLQRLQSLPVCILLVLAMLLGAGLKAAGIPPFQRDAISHERFGVGFRLEVDHEQAVAFLRDNGVRGRVFNIFEDGQSIIWYGWPDLTVFIDGRGAIPEAMLAAYSRAFSSPETLATLQRQFGFEVILLRRNLAFETNPHGAKSYFRDPAWSLVYFDRNSYLFLRNQGPYAEVIARSRFHYVLANGDIGTYLEFMALNPDYPRGLIADLERVPVDRQAPSDRLLLGYSYFKGGDYAAALAVLAPVRNDSGSALLLYGHTLRALGRAVEARAAYQDGVERYKTRDFEVALRETDTAEQAGQLLQQAAEAMSRNDYGAARTILETILRGDPDNLAALTNLGYCELHDQRYAAAEQLFLRAVGLNENYDVALYGLGLLQAKQNRRDLATGYFRRYMALRSSGPYYEKAKAYVEGRL